MKFKDAKCLYKKYVGERIKAYEKRDDYGFSFMVYSTYATFSFYSMYMEHAKIDAVDRILPWGEGFWLLLVRDAVFPILLYFMSYYAVFQSNYVRGDVLFGFLTTNPFFVLLAFDTLRALLLFFSSFRRRELCTLWSARGRELLRQPLKLLCSFLSQLVASLSPSSLSTFFLDLDAASWYWFLFGCLCMLNVYYFAHPDLSWISKVNFLSFLVAQCFFPIFSKKYLFYVKVEEMEQELDDLKKLLVEDKLVVKSLRKLSPDMARYDDNALLLDIISSCVRYGARPLGSVSFSLCEQDYPFDTWDPMRYELSETQTLMQNFRQGLLADPRLTLEGLNECDESDRLRLKARLTSRLLCDNLQPDPELMSKLITLVATEPNSALWCGEIASTIGAPLTFLSSFFSFWQGAHPSKEIFANCLSVKSVNDLLHVYENKLKEDAFPRFGASDIQVVALCAVDEAVFDALKGKSSAQFYSVFSIICGWSKACCCNCFVANNGGPGGDVEDGRGYGTFAQPQA